MNEALQRDLCAKFGADYLAVDGSLKVGISRSFDSSRFPINGLRHPPEHGTSGWFIWSGEEFSTNPDFFRPLHAVHLSERCPETMRYLGLGPGWRFLIAPDQEDVWFDKALLS